MARGGFKATVLIVGALGCGVQPAKPAVVPPKVASIDLLQACNGSTRGRCAHPIDRIVLDDLSRRGLALPEPNPVELCRRLALDTLGQIPTEHELRRCLSQPHSKTVDAWLASRSYAALRQRIWAQRIGGEDRYGWAKHAEDWDALLQAEADGKLPYDVFASQAVLHPVFYNRHPSEDWIRATYDVFIGRSARQDEVVGLTPLLPIWSRRNVWMSDQRWVQETAFDLCQCPTGGAGCVSETLGSTIDFRTDACDPSDEKLLVRLVDHSLERTHRPKSFPTNEQVRRVDPADTHARAALQSFPQALTARPEFWEFAVDRELRRLLGWWQTSFAVADTELPEVRRVLVRILRDSKQPVDVTRAILTSILYTMPSTITAGDDASKEVPWAVGPRKMMSGRAWALSATAAAGFTSICDPMTQADLVRPYTRGRREGGAFALFERLCGDSRALVPSPAILDAQVAVSSILCSRGANIVPTEFDDDDPDALVNAAAHLVRTLLQRKPRRKEARSLAKDMKACLQADDACETKPDAIRWTCTRLLQSAAFGSY